VLLLAGLTVLLEARFQMRVRLNTRKGSKRPPLTIFRINTYAASATVDSKELAETLSRLDATLTKNTGEGGH